MINDFYQAYYYQTTEDNVYVSHFHNEIEFLLPLSEFSLQIEDRVVTLHAGNIVLLKAHTLHNQVNLFLPCNRYVLHIDEELMKKVFPFLPKLIPGLSGDNHVLDVSQDFDEIKRMFSALLKRDPANEGGELEDLSCFLRLLHLLLPYLAESEGLANSTQFPASDWLAASPDSLARVHQLQEYMENHLSEPLTLDQIAEAFFINKYYLSHLFKEATGYSVIDYLSQLRIEKACKMLRDGLSINRVQEQLGFQNNGYFYRLFKKRVGCSPKQYAKKYENLNGR